MNEPEGRWHRSEALFIIALLAIFILLLGAFGCASPTAPDPCAKPDTPKGCTPPTCAHPVCY